MARAILRAHSLEVGAAFNADPGAAELAILDDWRDAAEHQLPHHLCPPRWPRAAPGRRIGAALRAWANASPRPLVVFLDEIDALQDQALISVLRQLRVGSTRRPDAFPAALALIGLRDVRDYKVASGGSERLTTASPFNIKVEALTLPGFSPDEVATLYAQHTTDTNQPFTADAVRHAFDLTQGQPWLVVVDTLALELKVWRDRRPDPLAAGLEQLDGYLARLGLATGWLVIFDCRSGQPPIAERTRAEVAASPDGRTISVIRA